MTDPSAVPPVTTLFQDGEFTAASGQTLPFKIECDALTDADWKWAARYVALRISFSFVEGVPEGGLWFADALAPYGDELGGAADHTHHLLIVDDVLTTGESMERQRNGRTAKGVVLFARGPVPDWVTPIWTLVAPPDTTAIVGAAREVMRKVEQYAGEGIATWANCFEALDEALAAHDKAVSGEET